MAVKKNTEKKPATKTPKRLTQTEIIDRVSDISGIKKSEAKELFQALSELAASEVRQNGEFTLPGFGKLVKTTRKAREGRNPATGEAIRIQAKTTVKFRLGKSMKDASFSDLPGDSTLEAMLPGDSPKVSKP